MAAVPGLNEFIAGYGRRRFEWSRSDQWFFVADWIELATGHHVAGAWRGAYRSCEEACARLDREQFAGPLDFCKWSMRSNGLERTRCALAGDIALCVDRDREGRAAIVPGICLDGHKRAIRIRNGVAIGYPRTVLAWKLPHG